MGAHTLFTCTLCDAPIQMNANQGFVSLNVERQYRRREAVHLDLGYSRGGWGRRQQWLTFSSEIVCGECFDQIEKLIKPLQEFIACETKENPIPSPQPKLLSLANLIGRIK